MKGTCVDIKDFKKEANKRKVKDTFNKYVVDPAVKVYNWTINHPYEAVAIAATFVPIATKVIRLKQTSMEDRRRAIDFYDPRVGRHVFARRPLTKSEALEVDRRYASGESYTMIFDDMRLLK